MADEVTPMPQGSSGAPPSTAVACEFGPYSAAIVGIAAETAEPSGLMALARECAGIADAEMLARKKIQSAATAVDQSRRAYFDLIANSAAHLRKALELSPLLAGDLREAELAAVYVVLQGVADAGFAEAQWPMETPNGNDTGSG